MKTVKTKLLAMLMAAVMVFAMAPLATGIAFADEEDVDAVEVTDVVDDTEEAEPQLEAAEGEAPVDKGELVFDLSNGPVTYPVATSTSAPIEIMMLMMGGSQGGPFDPWFTMVTDSQDKNIAYICLDQNETKDVKLTSVQSPDASGSVMMPEAIIVEQAAECSIEKSITIPVSETCIEYLKSGVMGSMPYYYSKMTFVFADNTPAKVKAANTLAIKGKTAKIKKKKLKKKNQTLKVSKVIKFSNQGQGALSYKLTAAKKGKKSFKKYFKMNAKSGKVTVKKKLKKGTYKVTVNVTAAGNDDYDGITKKVTFKVKVK